MVNKYKFVYIVLYSVLLYITMVIYFPINHTYKCLNSKSFLPLITEGKTGLVYKAPINKIPSIIHTNLSF